MTTNDNNNILTTMLSRYCYYCVFHHHHHHHHQHQHRRRRPPDRLLLLATTIFTFLIGQTFAIYNSVSPEVDIDQLPHPALIHANDDPNDYLRFLTFENHLGFVGGRNNLMVLNMTASLEQRRIIARDLTFPMMNDTQQACLDLFNDDPKESELLCRSTYVRAFLRRQTDDSVVFCGIGAFEPRCWICKDAAKRMLHEASDLYDFQLRSYQFQQINSGKDIVPFEPDSNFTSFQSDGKVFSGIYETPEINSAIFQPVIIARPLSDLDVVNAGQQELLTRHVIAESASLSRPHFVGSLDGGEFGYMFFNEQKSAKIAQFCKNGPSAVGTTGSTVSASFFKAFLFCGFLPQLKTSGSGITPLNVESLFSSSSPPFRFEQLADVTPLSSIDGNINNNRFFYGAFNRDPDAPSSVGICLFEEGAIRQIFAKSPFVRLTSAGGAIKPVLPVAYGTEDLSSRPNNCSAQFSDAEKVALHNFRVKYTNIYRLATMVNSQPVFYDTTVNYRLTSIAVDWMPNLDRPGWQHVLYVGTSNGRLLRIAVDVAEQSMMTSSSRILRNSVMKSSSSPSVHPQSFETADLRDPYGLKIATRLLTRVQFFSESSPVMRLAIWPTPGGYKNKRQASVAALLVVSKTSVGIHFVRSGETCSTPLSTSCSCESEGHPYCVYDANLCRPSNNLLVSNKTFRCLGDLSRNNDITPVSTPLRSSGRERSPVGDSDGETDHKKIIAIVAVCVSTGLLGIFVFVLFRKCKIIKPEKKGDQNNEKQFSPISSMPLTSTKPPLSEKVEVATEMTPTNTPKQKQRRPLQPIASQFSTLRRHGSKLSDGRNNLVYLSIPTWKSLPDQLNEDQIDLKLDMDADDEDEEDFAPSPAGETQLSRLSPSDHSGASWANQHNNDEPPLPTPKSLPTPTPTTLNNNNNNLIFTLPPSSNGQPHNRIQFLPQMEALNHN